MKVTIEKRNNKAGDKQTIRLVYWYGSHTDENGKGFASHGQIAQAIGCGAYFAKPYHSWERGQNENANGLLRQYFPKAMGLQDITARQVLDAVHKLNGRPRKCLGFKTPYGAFLGLSGMDAEQAGSRYFCESLFWVSQPLNRLAQTCDRYCLRGVQPFLTTTLRTGSKPPVRHPTRGGSHHPNDSTRCRDALHNTTQKTLRENAQPYRFWGLLDSCLAAMVGYALIT